MQIPCFILLVCSLIWWSRINASPSPKKKDESPSERFDKLLKRSSLLNIPYSLLSPYKTYTDTLEDLSLTDRLQLYPNAEQRRAYLDKTISNYEQLFLLQRPLDSNEQLLLQYQTPGQANQGKKYNFRDLFYRSYVKQVERKEPKPGFMERLYILCTKIPIIGRFTCPVEEEQLAVGDPWTRYDNVWTKEGDPSVVFVEDSYEPTSRKSEPENPLQNVEKYCQKGSYTEELDTCLLFVDQEMNFKDAKQHCEEIVDEGGRLWLSNSNAQIADEILIANRIVEETYSAWIDATYLSDTLAGTGNFDSDYKMWLELGQVRGRPTMRDKITLSGNEYESFYTYVDEDQVNSFICQSTPLVS